ncbi:PREDICTED: mitogen-activated protein kinase kinase kinase YODA-like [Tarenaya hassleriana]|uniref:mitogen-activated protein kinase kinase kinase YODA-like n=1 Tax=Tarenaya hassleriana TaxID=28532 RepID=UPI00053C2807|nr:PREDICTED: mitogen-activated protein kinase kinase kinase YODA-like [Tarenaya hassleriana]
MAMFRATSTSYWSDNEGRPVRFLGQGGYGHVTLVEFSPVFPSETEQYLAKKTSLMSKAESIRREIRILCHFNVPNIVRPATPFVYTETVDGLEACSIYLEYASKGTLSDVIKENGGRLREKHVKCFTRMILRGLMALHAEGYVHCDLKPANILAFPSKAVGEICELKISDFGSAKEPAEDGFLTDNKICPGTLLYMSSESIGPGSRILSALDIWSLGCVVLEMFGASCFLRTVPEDISDDAKDFISRCMKVNPAERWSAEWLMRHAFLTR